MRCFRSLGFALVLTGAIGCGSQADAGGSASGKDITIPGPGNGSDEVDEGMGSPDAKGLEPAGGRPLGTQDLLCTGAPFDKQLFPGDTNTMVAALSARQVLSDGRSPLPSSIRAQDFFNYYGVDLTASEAAPDVPRLAIEVSKRSAPGRFDIAVAFQAPPVTNDQRKPLVLTVVVDLTPSMWGLGLSRAQESLAAIAQNLKAGDSVQLLTTRPADVVQSFSIQGANDPALIEATDALDIENEGSIVTALVSSYEIARKYAVPDAWNRILVLSAGDAPEEAVPEELIVSAAKDDHIFLVAAATGSSYGEFQRFLGTASRLGRGPYVYLGVEGAPTELLGGRFNELFGYGMDDISLTLTLPGHARLLPDSPSAPDVQSEWVAQYIGPGASQLFLFKITSCAQPPASDRIGIKVDYNDQNGKKAPALTKEAPFPDANSTDHPVYDKTAAIVAYVEALRSMDPLRIGFAKQAVADAELTVKSQDDLDDLAAMGQLLELHPAQ